MTTDETKSMQLLHSEDEGVIRKALQRLHVKWYHAETERLQSLLRAVAVPAKVCNLDPQVVRSCQACRPWRRPGQSDKPTYNLSLAFNDEVQLDSLFYRPAFQPGLGGEKDIPIMHLTDCCIRWSVCMMYPSRSASDLLNCTSTARINVFGNMWVSTSDGETGMRAKEAGDWAMYNQVA